METLLTQCLNWLNATPEERTVRLQRDGIYPFLGYADLNQPPVPILTFRNVAWMLILAASLPIAFMG